jgi:hypothetical protein
MQYISPVIRDGDLQLINGQLEMGHDIVTQLPVTLSLYDAMYEAIGNSELIPYIKQTKPQNVTKNEIAFIVKNALQPLFYEGIIASFVVKQPQITITAQGIETIKITINVLDSQNNERIFSWANLV